MATRKKKNSQAKLLNEVKDQLVLQAERWGKKGYYTPLRLNEMVLEQGRRISGDLFSERANLEYELHLLDSDKRELLIKMERLQNYIKKAHRVVGRYEKEIQKQLERVLGDQDKIKAIIKKVKPGSSFSVLLSSN